MSKRKENKDVLKLSKREIDGLCADWKPEPLLDPVTDEEKWQLKCVPVIHGQNGAHISVSLQHSKVPNGKSSTLQVTTFELK